MIDSQDMSQSRLSSRPLNINLSQAFLNNALHSYALVLKATSSSSSSNNAAAHAGTPATPRATGSHRGVYVLVKNAVDVPLSIGYPSIGPVPPELAHSSATLRHHRRVRVEYRDSFPVTSAVARNHAEGVRDVAVLPSPHIHRPARCLDNLTRSVVAVGAPQVHNVDRLVGSCWLGAVVAGAVLRYDSKCVLWLTLGVLAVCCHSKCFDRCPVRCVPHARCAEKTSGHVSTGRSLAPTCICFTRSPTHVATAASTRTSEPRLWLLLSTIRSGWASGAPLSSTWHSRAFNLRWTCKVRAVRDTLYTSAVA